MWYAVQKCENFVVFAFIIVFGLQKITLFGLTLNENPLMLHTNVLDVTVERHKYVVKLKLALYFGITLVLMHYILLKLKCYIYF